MNTRKILTAALLTASILSAACVLPFDNAVIPAAHAQEAKKPNIKILATGGTIAGSAAANTTTTGYTSGAISVDNLIKAVPEMQNLANISGEQITNASSTDMNDEILLALGKRINELLASKDVDGVVVTHGTSTLEETAYFLNLVVKSDKPVVVVGSMRPATAISADGPFNLYNAVLVAASKEAKGRGAMILLNDRIGSAREVTKTNTAMLDTFKSAEHGYLGVLVGGKPYFYNASLRKHTMNSEFDISKLDKLPAVDILYGYQNSDKYGYLYEAAVKAGIKGIVIAAPGNGSISKATQISATDAQKKGLVIVRSSRVGSGVVNRLSSDDTNKFIAADSLNPQKARILLMLALTKTNDLQKIQKYFDEY
ncbi:MAG: ansZ [Herbaspirillum sp.]|nr:ansZ [Herbaspirillum sp.]